jgi:putative endonuclease
MIGCYIIHSEKLNRYYVGATQDNVTSRIDKHNNSSYGKQKFTSTANDWKLTLFIPVNDFAHAIRIEHKIKSMKSTKYIQNLIFYPELVEKLTRNTWL